MKRYSAAAVINVEVLPSPGPGLPDDGQEAHGLLHAADQH